MPWIFKVPFLIPPWAAAQTWGFVILWNVRWPISASVLAHELRHVDQARRLLWVGWPFAYLIAWIRADFNYTNISYEVDARKHASDPYYLNWAKKLIAERNLK